MEDDSSGADKLYAEGGEFFLCEIDPVVIRSVVLWQVLTTVIPVSKYRWLSRREQTSTAL